MQTSLRARWRTSAADGLQSSQRKPACSPGVLDGRIAREDGWPGSIRELSAPPIGWIGDSRSSCRGRPVGNFGISSLDAGGRIGFTKNDNNNECT